MVDSPIADSGFSCIAVLISLSCLRDGRGHSHQRTRTGLLGTGGQARAALAVLAPVSCGVENF